MDVAEQMRRKAEADARNQRTGFDSQAARQMPAPAREAYETAWKNTQKK